MKERNVVEVKRQIAVLWETLQCPICLDLLTEPVSTKCDHQFCKFCMMKLLESNKQRRAACPVCKTKVTKRSLQESAAFQRLVTGLQDMIQAYERDSGLNYFTGLSKNKELSFVGTCSEIESEQCEISDGKTDQHEVAHDDLTRSPSTVAAQNRFALVMGFEDDNPARQPDGLDCGLGVVQQSPAIMPDGWKNNEALIKSKEIEEGDKNAISYLPTGHKAIHSECEAGASVIITSGQLDGRTRRRCARKKQAKEPEHVLEQKRKKSMEKVAMWLSKVPAEGVLGLEKSTEEANYSDSSTSTLDIKLYNVEVNSSSKGDQAKVLEEQVFGAVYKRGRRANRFSFHPQKTPTPSRPKSISNLEKFSGASQSVRNCHNVEANEQLENETCSHVERAACETGRDETKKINERIMVDKFLENEAHKCHDEDRASRQPRRSSKRKRNTLQEFDSNLKVPKREGNCMPKKTDKRQGKGVQVSKPLVLEQIDYQETIPKANVQAEVVQIHIENYPSSEETTMRTTTRSSSRFQFNEAFKDKNAPESMRKNSKSDKAQLQVKPLSILSSDQRNGCICDNYMQGIENMDENEAVTPLADKSLCKIVSPSPGSATGKAVTYQQPKGSIVHVSETTETRNESEEDKNDSEMDTEQLVKSFKSTKRKSFHLGDPSEKRSPSVGEKPVLINETVEGDATSSKSKCVKTTSQSSVGDVDNSNCSALIPPSNIEAEDDQAQPSGLACSPEQDSRSSLSPNKVSKLLSHSSPCSSVTQIGDSGLYHQAVKRISLEPLSQDAPDSMQNSASLDIVKGVQNELSQETHAGLLNVYSLIHDGLDASHDSVRTNRLSQSLGVLPANQNQRKEPLRLESPSGSEKCDNDLPALVQILEVSAHDPHDDNDRKQGAERTGVVTEEQQCLAPSCSSPDYVQSSQASVDLFDPPAMAEALGHHNNVYMDSSQFSSDVLVTQKIEMQNDLLTLKKLIGLVTEVLQEKQEDHTTFPAVQPLNALQQNGTVTSLSPMAPKTEKKSISFSEDRGGTREQDRQKVKLTLVSSGLEPLERKMVKMFAKQVNACVVSRVTTDVTHVIMCTDEQLVCERTLKYFQGISSRKWVVSFHWISECFRQKKFLDEQPFEVKGDVVNGHNHLGPMRARTSDESHLLMKGYKVCFQGPFTDMTIDEMEWMVEQCGAAVVKDPLLFKTNQHKSVQLVIVQSRPELWLSTHSNVKHEFSTEKCTSNSCDSSVVVGLRGNLHPPGPQQLHKMNSHHSSRVTNLHLSYLLTMLFVLQVTLVCV
ncbi:uncharacterized protein LOC128758595 isoform X2 [Synchiropus splendidus]|uniref:uncharacterized protein LOC128758595 isoform X2 n=1 Tax=Synchiropus splendidus TaxID=270530 RepID=UPI00237D53A4|nr:uncharacterized protein LOC128758595 isoform X2 [Synchiropus splendidus]